MFVLLSKILPLFFYPLGFAILLLVLSVLFHNHQAVSKTLILIAIVILWLSSSRWVALPLARSLEWRYLPLDSLPQVDAIVLLGGGTESQQYPRPIPEMNSAGDRVLYAAHLYRQGVAPNILLTGGYIPQLGTRTSTPADDMASLLEMWGIPEEALWLEGKSRNTYENALYSYEILEQRNIQRIVLVTSALHMPRSVALFEHYGLEVFPAPVDFTVTQDEWRELTSPNLAVQLLGLLPNSSNLSLTTVSLKEYIGIFVYWLRGWM